MDLLRWWRRDRELDDEIRAHLAMAVRDRIEPRRATRRGRIAVRREFGASRW
jgi:hypothetical protein